MIYTNELSFAKDIKNNPLNNLYLLYGSETYLIDLYTNMIKKLALKNGDENFNFSLIDANKIDLNVISQSCEAMPLLSEKRVVVIINPPFDKWAKDDDFKNIISDIPPYTVVIIVIKTDSFSQKKNQGFIKNIDKYGAVIGLYSRSENDLIKYIMSMAKKADCEIEKTEAQLLITKCSADMLKINMEMEKLTAYAQKSQITEAMIEKITMATVEAQIYDLSKYINFGDINKAMEILDKLYYLKQPTVLILATLSMFYADIYKAKIAKKNNIKPTDSAEIFGYKPNDFRIEKAFRDCTKYNDAYLSEIINILANADLKLKSSRINERVLVEKAITEIFLAKEK